MKDFLTILGALENLPVLVIGDLMLDHFIYGQATRLSPESPVPVLNKTHATQMLGGAGNVLSNLCGLTVRAHCLSVCGDDTPAHQVKALLTQSGIDPSGVITDPSRPTTQKTRFVAGQHQLLRMDEEKITPLSPVVESQLLSKVENLIPSIRAVVISDYGKGVVTPTLTRAVIELAQARKIPVFVDPKSKDYALYAKADVLTPNKKELSEAFGQEGLQTDEQITTAARRLMTIHGIKAMVVTRSEDGLSVVEQADADTLHDPVQARSVFDVSGAGDTVIACLAAFVAAGASLKDAARLANIAGGIVVGKAGTAPITLDELKGALENTPQTDMQQKVDDGRTASPPIWTLEQAKAHIARWRDGKKKIGFTNGCFDVLHAGHVHYLSAARAQCDHLIVGLNHDQSVRLLKGASRPINPQEARAQVLMGLSAVDGVILFGAEKAGADNTPIALITALKPDIYFKGGDYTRETLPETPIVESYGGRVELLSFLEGFSTTNTLKKM